MNFSLRAVAFDAYGTLFDVYSVSTLAERIFPGRGADLAALWRDKQVDYTRLRTLSSPHSGPYRDFRDITRDGLRFAARKLGLALDLDAEQRLMAEYDRLTAFPENLGALRDLKALGIPMAILSNGTPSMLGTAVASAGMDGLFDHLLSVAPIRTYKTTAAAYQLGPDAFGLPVREILFVSSNAWDACGATWFGYTTFWINRTGQPEEELGITPTASGRLLTDVYAFVKQHYDKE